MTAADDRALVQGWYDAFARGDLDAVRGYLASDVEFHNPEYAIESGVRRGVDAFIDIMERLHDMFEYGTGTAEPETIERSGDCLVVEFHTKARARGSGLPLDDRQGHLWHLRDGKVVRLSWFRTVEEARAAALHGESNAELLRRLYEAWQAGDTDAALAYLAPDVEWIEPDDNPDGSRWSGEAGVLESVAKWTEPFADYRFEIIGTEELGDQVLIGLQQWGRGRSSGAPVESEIWHLWTVRDRRGVRMQMFRSRPEALEASAAG